MIAYLNWDRTEEDLIAGIVAAEIEGSLFFKGRGIGEIWKQLQQIVSHKRLFIYLGVSYSLLFRLWAIPKLKSVKNGLGDSATYIRPRGTPRESGGVGRWADCVRLDNSFNIPIL